MDAGDLESSVSRSYYAMFFAAEAALLTRDLTFSTQRAVAAAFGEHFAKAGLVTRSLGRDLSRALEKRLASDYDHARTMTRGDTEDLLVSARRFVGEVRALLGDHD